MTQAKNIFEVYAQYLNYPYDGCIQECKDVENILLNHSKFKNELSEFLENVKSLTPEKFEELYIKTFDVQASCCLDIGFILFGEDYKRGQFMAQLKILEKQYNVDCGSDLPDFLPNVLKLVSKLPYEEAREVVTTFIFPAVHQMVAGFGEKYNPYKNLILSLKAFLKTFYKIEEKEVDMNLPVIEEAQSWSQI